VIVWRPKQFKLVHTWDCSLQWHCGVFSFRAARADTVPADSSVASPKKTKSLRTPARGRASSDQDELVSSGELWRCVQHLMLHDSYFTWHMVLVRLLWADFDFICRQEVDEWYTTVCHITNPRSRTRSLRSKHCETGCSPPQLSMQLKDQGSQLSWHSWNVTDVVKLSWN